MNDIISNFIKDNVELLETIENTENQQTKKATLSRFYKLSQKIAKRVCLGELTDILVSVGIAPLKILDYVPAFCYDNSTATSLYIPEGVIMAADAAFSFSHIETIVLHDNFELAKNTFYNCSKLKSIRIPYIMNIVPEDCFYGCKSLTDVDLNTIEYIDEYAFLGCKSLKQILIPDDIEYIADKAFYNCHPDLCFHVSKDNDYAIQYARENDINLEFV